MSCFYGVFRVNKKEFDEFDRGTLPRLHCAAYNKSDGMSTMQCNGVAQPASAKTPDGRIWFPTLRGVVVLDPSAIREHQEPPPVVIEEMLADTHRATARLGRSLAGVPLASTPARPRRTGISLHRAKLVGARRRIASSTCLRAQIRVGWRPGPAARPNITTFAGQLSLASDCLQ